MKTKNLLLLRLYHRHHLNPELPLFNKLGQAINFYYSIWVFSFYNEEYCTQKNIYCKQHLPRSQLTSVEEDFLDLSFHSCRIYYWWCRLHDWASKLLPSHFAEGREHRDEHFRNLRRVQENQEKAQHSCELRKWTRFPCKWGYFVLKVLHFYWKLYHGSTEQCL
jgi:hypothetical protein